MPATKDNDAQDADVVEGEQKSLPEGQERIKAGADLTPAFLAVVLKVWYYL